MVLVAGGVAAAVAVAIFAVPGAKHTTAPKAALPPLTDAKAFLLASADITAKATAGAPGRYWYTQIKQVDRARQAGHGLKPHGASANGTPRSGPFFPFHAYVTITWENWDPYRQGQPSRTTDRDITAGFASPADKVAWQRAGSPSLSDMKPFTADSHLNEPYLELGPKGTKMADLTKLPATSAALQNLIRRDWDRQGKTLARAGAGYQRAPYTQYVREMALNVILAPVTPATRAAAYRLLASLPGMRMVGRVHDRLGRPGVALAYQATDLESRQRSKIETHLIIDPRSATVLSSDDYRIGAGGKAESEPYSSTLDTVSGWTDRIGVPARG
jgi:hypothetical protein